MQNVELVERHPQGFDRYKLRTHLKLIPRLGCLEGPLSKCQNAARGPELRAENRCQATNQTSKPTTKNGQFSRLLFDEPAQAANARPLPVLVAFPVKIYAYKSACYAFPTGSTVVLPTGGTNTWPFGYRKSLVQTVPAQQQSLWQPTTKTIDRKLIHSLAVLA